MKTAFINYQLNKPNHTDEYIVRFEQGGEFYHEIGHYCIIEKKWAFRSEDVEIWNIVGFTKIPR